MAIASLILLKIQIKIITERPTQAKRQADIINNA
jgi:hypothetical protein